MLNISNVPPKSEIFHLMTYILSRFYFLLIPFIEDNYFNNMKKDGKFEEDIDCIIEPVDGRGAIYISNIEAA